MDSGILSRVLDDIREYGGDYVIDRFDVGHEAADTSTRDDHRSPPRTTRRSSGCSCGCRPAASTWSTRARPSHRVADMDGVFPDGFYSTTNLPTRVRLGKWRPWRTPRWTAA